MLPRGPMVWNLGLASQRSNGLESWTCYPKVRWFGISDVLLRGLMIEIWTYFPEVRGFEVGRASQRSND